MQRPLTLLLLLIYAYISTGCVHEAPSFVNKSDSQRSFDYHFFENEPFTISNDMTVAVDVAIPKHRIHPALVIIQHGNHSRKEAHRNQVTALARAGFAVVAIQFPNVRQWHDNAVALSQAVPILKQGFSIRGVPVRTQSIVLVGHSFGGYAASVAAGINQDIKGVILLDPALYSTKGIPHIAKIKAPVVVIGADKRIFRSRKRNTFFEGISTKAIEFSVPGATHDDAQNPSMFALSSYGVDPYTSPKKQAFITDMLVESAKALTNRYQLSQFAERLRSLKTDAKIRDVRVRGHRF